MFNQKLHRWEIYAPRRYRQHALEVPPPYPPPPPENPQQSEPLFETRMFPATQPVIHPVTTDTDFHRNGALASTHGAELSGPRLTSMKELTADERKFCALVLHASAHAGSMFVPKSEKRTIASIHGCAELISLPIRKRSS